MQQIDHRMKNILLVAAAAALICSCSVSRNTPADQGVNGREKSVNVGYGSVERDKLTYSVDQLDVKDNEMSSYTNIWDYMRSRVPGVVIGEASAGGTPSIIIRGENSVNSSNQPLIMLDGMETDDISGLSPLDVASISVLKDASASIYGSRGGNGVILITTKSAKLAAEQEAAYQREARAAARAARAERKAARRAK